MIDSHVHLLPGRLGIKVRSFFTDAGIDDFAYPIDHAVIAEMLAADGITTVWNLPYAHKPGMALGLNEASAEVATADLAVAVVAGATVHPGDDEPVAVVRHAVGQLGCGVLKLHCSVGDHEPTDPRLDAVWDYVEEIRLPVVVHAGHHVNGQTAGDELSSLDEVARRHPEARIVIAHSGYPSVERALDLVERHAHVHADLTPVLRDLVAVPPARAEALASKLLLGTDAPNTCSGAGVVIDQVRCWGLPEALEAAVLGGNAARLQDGIRR